jgi:ribosomal protein S18 acetylase RimI-like enzyme
MAITVRAATASDIPAVSRTLALAFADDPVKLFLCGGQRLSVERAAPFFTAFQRIQLPHGHVYTASARDADPSAAPGAAAIWAPPGSWKVPFREIVRHSPTFLRLYGLRFFPNLQVLTDLEKRHPTEPHYYLEFIGTDPTQQSRGLGTALMQPMVEQADVEGVGMYLESSKESNVAFYSRFGFRVREELTHRRNGPTQWLMWRPPVPG